MLNPDPWSAAKELADLKAFNSAYIKLHGLPPFRFDCRIFNLSDLLAEVVRLRLAGEFYLAGSLHSALLRSLPGELAVLKIL